MPDGPIIRAWQLINESDKDTDKIKELFGEALNRGTPIYTEGLRLLIKGLKMLYYQNTNDEKVEKNYLKAKEYLEATDWGYSTTTFLGAEPEKPSTNSEKGMPDTTSNMAYLFSVPLTSIINAGSMAFNTKIEIASDLDETIEVEITEKGTLIDNDGKEFYSAYEALKSLDENKKIARIEAKDQLKNQELNNMIKEFRLGHKKF